MKSKLKQNWKRYLINGILIYLIFFFPSSQEEYYLKKDLIKFSFIDSLKIFGVILIISVVYFYYFFSDEKDTFIKIAKIFSYSISIGLFFNLLMLHIVFSIGLLTNRLIAKHEVIEKFEIYNINKSSRSAVIKSLNTNYTEYINGKFSDIDLLKIKEKDTISIIFKKGIFGKKYLQDAKVTLKY